MERVEERGEKGAKLSRSFQKLAGKLARLQEKLVAKLPAKLAKLQTKLDEKPVRSGPERRGERPGRFRRSNPWT